MQSNFPLVVTILLQAAVILLCLLFIYRLFQLYRIYVSKTHLESAFDSIDDPLAIVSNKYRIQRLNRAYAALVGDSFTELLGKDCHEVLRGRSSPCEDCRLSKVLSTGQKQYVANSPHPREPDQRTLSFTFYPFLEKNGQRLSVVEHIRDITELERLRRDLEDRNRVLEETSLNLRQAQRDIKDELDLARQVQHGTLPQTAPRFAGLKIAMTYQPIESVGGDVYDFVRLPGDRLGLFIGDASGHGLSSAFVSTISKMLLKNHSTRELGVSELLDGMNHDLLENVNTSHYLTCWWGIFDPADNSLTYARAGHPVPILLRRGGEVCQLDASGTFAGIIENPVYEQRKVFLQKGDRCCFFTDGIYEAIDKMADGSGMLGYNRFREIVTATNRLPFEELLPAIKGELGDYTYEDDFTIVVVEVTSEGLKALPESLATYSLNDNISVSVFHRLEEVDERMGIIARTLSKAGHTEQEVAEIKRCIVGLADNAFRHGNRGDAAKAVTLTYAITPSTVKVCVEDEGEGFDLEAVLSRATDGSGGPGPTGLATVKKFATRLGQGRKGNVVYFIRERVAHS